VEKKGGSGFFTWLRFFGNLVALMGTTTVLVTPLDLLVSARLLNGRVSYSFTVTLLLLALLGLFRMRATPNWVVGSLGSLVARWLVIREWEGTQAFLHDGLR